MALSLMVTCMYSGDADKREEPDSDDKYFIFQEFLLVRPLSYMENMERVQLLFSKIHKKGFPHEVDVLLRFVFGPSLTLEFFLHY